MYLAGNIQSTFAMRHVRDRQPLRPRNPPVGMSRVTPRQRPSMSPREYQARLDLLHVQDCLWARMKPAEISRKLGKDKAWVSRAIQRLETERQTEYRSPREADLIGDNLRQLESLLSGALAVAQREKDAKTHLAALRTAADLLRQKSEYQITIGYVCQRDAREDAEKQRKQRELNEYVQEHLPEEAVMKILEIRMASKKRKAEEAARVAESEAKKKEEVRATGI